MVDLFETLACIGLIGSALFNTNKDQRKVRKDIKNLKTDQDWFWYRFNKAESAYDKWRIMDMMNCNMRGEKMPPYQLKGCEGWFNMTMERYGFDWSKSWEETQAMFDEVDDWKRANGLIKKR